MQQSFGWTCLTHCSQRHPPRFPSGMFCFLRHATVMNASPWALKGDQPVAVTAFLVGGDMPGQTQRSQGEGPGDAGKRARASQLPEDGPQRSLSSANSRCPPKAPCCTGAGPACGPRAAVQIVDEGSVSAATAKGNAAEGTMLEQSYPQLPRVMGT